MKLPLLAALISLFAFTTSKAQEETREPTYQRFPVIPPFSLQAPDNSTFTREDLPKHRKTIIMYFSPDCDHCKHQTEDLLKNMDRLKGVQIVMATYQPFEEMVAFYKEHEISKYPSIKMGRDTKFFFVPYYKISNLPYLALYDAKGDLIKTFEGNVSIAKLTAAFEKKKKK